MQKVKISFFLNGELIERELDPSMRVLDFLREDLWLTGTKEGCGEGDCGACTVTLASACQGKVSYRSMNSCLMPVGKLQGTSLITVEGIGGENGELNLIQEAMLEKHGLQCGFCSPGFIMSMFSLAAEEGTPTYEELVLALEGNICRCTGYEGIMETARLVADSLKAHPQADVVPAKLRAIEPELSKLPQGLQAGDYLMPLDFGQLDGMRKEFPDAVIVSGSTDLSVRAHATDAFPPRVIDVSRVREMLGISHGKGCIVIGASEPLSQIAGNEIASRELAPLCNMLGMMAHRGIRNFATLAGNICNASPIADSVVMLFCYDARLLVRGPAGERSVAIREFYLDYKKMALAKDEIVWGISIPDSALEKSYRFEKTSKRKAVDIASVNSAVSYTADAEGNIQSLEIAFGGVDKTVRLVRLGDIPASMDEKELAAKAASVASSFAPLSDVRGSATYRSQLIRNHIIKHVLAIREVD
ncbi:MAG: FAD binding domain-containing protein [Spirochaetia bacterium]|jgi:xanthine dehydrogenase small subunit|nr:FAD binding domain-containing protein [Spirochaetia bacterium]